jgi:hypothetical protein
MDPPGFWLSSFKKSVHGPVSKRVSCRTGVAPIRATEEFGGVRLIAFTITNTC